LHSDIDHPVRQEELEEVLKTVDSVNKALKNSLNIRLISQISTVTYLPFK